MSDRASCPTAGLPLVEPGQTGGKIGADSATAESAFADLEGETMPIATPEVYAEMLDRAKAGSFAYPAINVTSSQTLNAAIRGFADAGSDGIIQVSTGGAESWYGPT